MGTYSKFRAVMLSGCLWLVPTLVWAQSATSGAIAGVVRDATGGVLPGVTVEAASPALIEKVRTAVTDLQGNYKIVDLRPGMYSVTFTLVAFSTVKRDGIELTTGFTATVNADMKVGAVEETITVTAASPVVDVQNVRTQNVLARDVIDALPNNRTYQGFASLTLGATTTSPDVGGNKGDAATAVSIHGANGLDGKVKIDGMNMNIPRGNPSSGAGASGQGGGGQQLVIVVNQMAMQETVLETSGISAESETGNVQVNYVPKDGGNIFRGSFLGNYTNGDLQSNNLNDEIRARGVTLVNTIDTISDVGLGVGGPIRKNKLWFYDAWRRRGAFEVPVGGSYFNALPRSSLLYAPDTTRGSLTSQIAGWDNTVRLTWQAAAKHRITASIDLQETCLCAYGLTSQTAPEASTAIPFGGSALGPSGYFQSSWNYAPTNKLLFEAGGIYLPNKFAYLRRFDTTTNDISVLESGTGVRYNAGVGYKDPGTRSSNYNGRLAVSYVTGSHAFRTGVQYGRGVTVDYDSNNQSRSYTFRNGVPLSLTQYAHPLFSEERVNQIAVFGQDQWTINRLTLNLGLRYDVLNGMYPEQGIEAGPFRPAASFPGGSNLPNWKDLTPRVGAAYDLFGNGRTALKASFGRYVQSRGTDIAQAGNPVYQLVQSATRNWGDTNGNFIPDCNLSLFTANGECGPLSNNKFGTVVSSSHGAPEWLDGFGMRDYNWQVATSIQQELRSGMAVNVGYFRNSFKNVAVSRNLLVSASDYDPYCITAPLDPRLPGGGGNQLCGLYDINPSKFGQVDYVVSLASDYGDRTEVFNGVEISLSARFGHGGRLGGGFSFGQKETNTCFVVNSPQELRSGYCDVTSPWWNGGGQAKFNAIYPLKWGFQVSGIYQNVPGSARSATYTATNAEISRTLGRNVGSCLGAAVCNGTINVSLIPPSTVFEKRLNQLDVRFTKSFRILGRGRAQGMFEIYNMTNSGTILSSNSTYGPAWLRPTSILGARVFKFGAQLDF